MLDVETTLLGLTAALNAGLFVFVYLGNRKSPINRSFAGFALCLSIWSLLHVGFRVVESDALAGELLKISYVCALLIGAFFYYFSIAFPEGERPRSIHAAGLSLSTILFSFVLLTPGFLTGVVVRVPYGRAVILRLPDYIAFATIFLALFIGGQIRVWLKFRKASDTVRTQLLTVGTAVTAIGLIGIYFDLVLPSPLFESFQYVWTGPVLTSVFAIAITYAIFRYRLFDLKAAITELLIFAWWLFIVIRALAASSLTDALADVALLAVSMPIGALLLRSLRLEEQTRETLAAANEGLKEANDMKSELLAIATHQLRQPVTIVRAYASMLRDGLYGRFPKQAQEPIERILHSATQMGAEITDYLSVAKIDQGQLRYAFEETELNKLVGDLVHDFQPQAIKKRLRLIFVPDPGRQYLAHLDRSKIQQVFSNLIENAIHYTEDGTVKLDLTEGSSAEWVRLTVQDTGIGVAPEMLPRLFKRYSRAQNASRLRAEGSGLGLYVARQFVEGHGGRISATSDGSGKGATFCVELPVHQPSALGNAAT